MDDRDETDWLNHEAMEGHIWRLAMDKTILLSMIAVVLLATMAVSRVALVTTTKAPGERTVSTAAERPVFVECRAGRTTASEGAPAMTGRTVAIRVSEELGACIDEAYAKGATSVVLGKAAKP